MDDCGNYVELVSLLRIYNYKLVHHFETCTVLSGLSSRVQNDPSEAVGNVLMNVIKAEIKDATFCGDTCR